MKKNGSSNSNLPEKLTDLSNNLSTASMIAGVIAFLAKIIIDANNKKHK